MLAAHQRHEPLAVNAIACHEAERAKAAAEPGAGGLTPPGVVILRARGDLPLVVLQLPLRRAELPDVNM